MTGNKSKKLHIKNNPHKKTITVIALVVLVFLAIALTFAWFTNRLNFLNGTLQIGELDYTVTVYDSSGNQEYNGSFTSAEDVATGTAFTDSTSAWASNKTGYKIVKVDNNSGIGIKPYASTNYTLATGSPDTLANYFYYYSTDVTSEVESAGGISSFVGSYNFPDINTISSADKTLGTISNNVSLLGTVPKNGTSYYLIAYGCKNLPADYLSSSYAVNIAPILSIGQENGPAPSMASSKTYYASSWQSLKSAIAKAADGDAIYLTGDVESPANTNLSLTNGVSLGLNGYNLTIHGDLAFNYHTTSVRSLTVPTASELRVEGDLIVDCSGPFTISGNGSSQNIILGTSSRDGNLYVDCGLSVSNGGRESSSVLNEASGFTLSDVIVKTYSGGTADVQITGSHTLVRVGSGAQVNSVICLEHPLNSPGTYNSDIYVVNYGKILTSVDLTNDKYSGQEYVGAYVKNYNSLHAVYLSSEASGFVTNSSAYNTRVINAPGADTLLNNTNVYVGGSRVDNTGSFRSQDIEPSSSEQGAQVSEVISNGNGSYTVKLKNTTGAPESISALFSSYGYAPSSASKIRIETYNGIRLQSTQFANLNSSNFSSLTTLDLSSTSVAQVDGVSTIPSGAFLNNSHLKNVTLPVTDINIGANAFQGSAINEITLGSNVGNIGSGAFDVSGNIAVIWQGSAVISSDNLGGFDVSKTIFFMDESLVDSALAGSLSDAWKSNFYEFYDFKSGDFYCKYSRTGATTTGCEIVYFAGSLSDYAASSTSDQSLIPSTISDPDSVQYSVTSINRQAYKKAITADEGSTTVNLIFPSSCETVETSAFEGSSSYPLHSNILNLYNVEAIGDKAFKNNVIATSAARQSGFAGMTELGEYAFAGTTISGGVLDLHGPTDRSFTPGNYAFQNAAFSGTSSANPYDSENANANAYLSLANSAAINATVFDEMTCKADLNLSGVGSIEASALQNVIKSDASVAENLNNVLDIRNVDEIGAGAFYGMTAKTVYAGCTSKPDDDAYTSIIGTTKDTGINNFVLSGFLPDSTTGNYTIASNVAGQSVIIANLTITADCREVADRAFATSCTSSAAAASNGFLKLGGATTQARTNPLVLGDAAFMGTHFTSSNEYNFSGVTRIDSECFKYSTVAKLNLGSALTNVTNANFIEACGNLVKITNYYNGITTLGGTPTASMISNSNLLIEVPADRLSSYINSSSKWYPWKNYFVANEYTFEANVNGSAYTSGVKCTWYYRIIEEGDTGIYDGSGNYVLNSDGYFASKGVQMVHCTFSNYTTAASLGNVMIPTSIENSQGTFMVTEFGGEGEMFTNVPDGKYIANLEIQGALKYIAPDAVVGYEYIRAFSTQTIGYMNTNSQNLTVNVTTLPYFIENENKNSFSTTDWVNYCSYKVTAGTSGTSSGAGSAGKSILARRATDSNNISTYDLAAYLTYAANDNTTLTISNAAASATVASIVSIRKGAISSDHVTTLLIRDTVAANTNLSSIESGAFENLPRLQKVTLNANNVLAFGENVFGTTRVRVMGADGYYHYINKKPQLTKVDGEWVPAHDSTTGEPLYMDLRIECPRAGQYDAYMSSSNNYFYKDFFVNTNNGTSLNSQQKKTVSAKELSRDVVFDGVEYHVMKSGKAYNDITYTSKETDFIAVVKGLTIDARSSKTIVIPVYITVDGVNYAVVGIDDNAFGENNVLERVVLPDRSLQYNSVVFEKCSNLGYIQFNDVAPYTAEEKETANVAPESATSLIEEAEENTSPATED